MAEQFEPRQMLSSAPLGHDATLSMLENTAHVFSASEFGFTDPNDSPPNHFMAVEITTVPDKGSLTNRGQAVTAAQFVPVADISAGNLRFTPASSATGSPYTAFTFQVQDDGDAVSGGNVDPTPRTMTIVVTMPPCQPPVTTNVTISAQEDTAYTFKTGDFPLSGCGDLTLSSVQIVATPSPSYYGSVRLSGVALAAGTQISGTDIAAGKLQFVPGGDWWGSSLTNIQVQVTDSSGGTNTIPITISVNVSPVNDPPLSCMWPTLGSASIGTQSHGGRPFYIAAMEDTTYVFSASDFGFCDPHDSPQDAFLNLIITLLPSSGTLRLDGLPITSANLPVVIPVSSLQVGRLSYVPPDNANGYFWGPGFKLQDSGGTTNGGQDTSVASSQVEFNIAAVNDAPVGHDNTVTTPEDQSYTFAAGDFGFSDPNDQFPLSLAGPNNLKAVRVVTLPGHGSLLDGTVPVDVGQFISLADINGGLLHFTPDANANSSAYASFTFQVQDDGGASGGGFALGVDIDLTPRTMTVNVLSVNDPPMGTDRTLAIGGCEFGSYVFTASSFGYSDSNDNPPNRLAGVFITGFSGVGALTDAGVNVASGQFVPRSDLDAGKLQYKPTINSQIGTIIAAITFQVKDDGGTANSGNDTELAAHTIQISISGQPNTPPNGIDYTRTINEDTPYTFHLGYPTNDPNATDFPFSDIGNNNFKSVIIGLAAPVVGRLVLNGINITPSPVLVSASDITAGNLKYIPEPTNWSGPIFWKLSFRVQDDGGTAVCNGAPGNDRDALPNTLTFSVLPVNDPPIGTSKNLRYQAGQPRSIAISDFGFSDAADLPFQNSFRAVKIDSLPWFGTLTDNGAAVVVGQVIPAADLAAGKLVFTSPNVSGLLPASLTFQVQDDGGTASGGIDLDPIPKTLYLVSQPNHAPVGADKTVTMLEDQTFDFYSSVFPFSDPADAHPDPIAPQEDHSDRFLGIWIVSLPTAGHFTINSQPVIAGQFINLQSHGPLEFAPDKNANGPTYASFAFQVQDDGGTAYGGFDTDPTPRTMTVDVRPVNQPPTFKAGGEQNVADESGPQAALWATKIVAGPPNEASQAVHFVILNNSNPALFSLQPAIDPVGNLTFTPAANESGSAEMEVVLQDDGGTASGGSDTSSPQMLTIHVAKAHVGHNAMDATDVTGDGHTAPNDAAAVINFINAFGSQSVTGDAEGTGSYCDVNADGFIAPNDALDVINQINAFGESEGEGQTTGPAAGSGDLIAMLAVDIAAETGKNGRGRYG